jgi:hypothetical protein
MSESVFPLESVFENWILGNLLSFLDFPSSHSLIQTCRSSHLNGRQHLLQEDEIVELERMYDSMCKRLVESTKHFQQPILRRGRANPSHREQFLYLLIFWGYNNFIVWYFPEGIDIWIDRRHCFELIGTTGNWKALVETCLGQELTTGKLGCPNDPNFYQEHFLLRCVIQSKNTEFRNLIVSARPQCKFLFTLMDEQYEIPLRDASPTRKRIIYSN